ncbi:MAG: flagellar basal-body MS-ring/collar protein FliF [Candidatus Nanopelagicales bacterium]
MTTLLQGYVGRARSAMSGFTAGQIGVIVVGVLGLVLAGFAFVRWNAAPMAPLFSNMATADASAVVQQLDSSGIAYELADGGTTILVPQDKVYATRLAMSAQGLPANSQDGYSLLDSQGITTSEFMQNVTYQRAVEGELASTIEAIDGVDTATVHLAMPEKSVFTQESDKPTASVMVKLRPGTALEAGQVQAITNLVASSVPKLTAGNVTVADSTGTLLSTGTGTGAAASTQAQAQLKMENQLASAAQTLLDNVVGTGNAAVRVHADLDFDTRETTTQKYDYTAGVPPISSSTTSEKYSGTGTVPGGVIGNGSTTATGTTGTSTQNNTYDKSSTTENNAVNSTQEVRTGAPGAVKRLTIAVLVNNANASVDPAVLTSLVSNAVGFDATRGDTIAVTPMKFDTSAADAAAAEIAAAADAESKAALFDLVKKAAIALLVIMVIGLAFLSSRKQRRQLMDADELAAIGFAPQPLAITRGEGATALDGAVVLPAVDEPRAIEQHTSDIQDLVAKQPEEVAQLLRGWIATGR